MNFRQMGDDSFDSFVSNLIQQKGASFVKDLVKKLGQRSWSDLSSISDEANDLLENIKTEYSTFNYKELSRAAIFYQKHKQKIGIILACYSLPYCYLGAHGVQVLYRSERIKNDTYSRLIETGQFVDDVLNYDHWRSGKIYTICFKIRLLHAIMRVYAQNTTTWQSSWGIPVCQEDMAGTNLSFSYLVIEGLTKMGIGIDETDSRAYLYVWAMVGQLLGLAPSLATYTIKDSYKLERSIAHSQFKPSAEGQVLTQSLVDTFKKNTNSEVEYQILLGQMWYYLGENYGKMLNLPVTSFKPNIFKNLAQIRGFFGYLYV